MSEAGHRILSARANKLRHRPERKLKRAHRADSFEDLHDAQGVILQHPTDRYSSSDSEEDEREAREEQAYQAQITKLKASMQPHVQSLEDELLTADQLRTRFDARLLHTNNEIRELESKVKRIDSKMRQMNHYHRSPPHHLPERRASIFVLR